jgi:cytochrome c-type biogenesis protein CcmH/NrfG
MAEQNYNKAYEAYQQAVYRDARNPTFWCSIGVLYYQINQVKFRDAFSACRVVFFFFLLTPSSFLAVP